MINMKKMILWLLVFLVLFSALSSAFADPLGFGVVNNTDVALRKAPGGQKMIRLPQDTCVWVRDAKTDDRGSLWYEVNLGYSDDGTSRSRSGWMKAEFIDAGETLWHDISSVKAGTYGMLALRKDGTVECVCNADNRELRSWAAGLRDIRQVSLAWLGWGFYTLDASGTFRDSNGTVGKDIRLMNDFGYPVLLTKDNRLLTGGFGNLAWVYAPEEGGSRLSGITAMTNSEYRILCLSGDGRVYAARSAADEDAYPEPAWENWTDVISIGAGSTVLAPGGAYQYTFAAVRQDGTVMAAPEELSLLLSSWRDIRKVSLDSHWILGLKNDGTAVILAPDGTQAPDVSGWSGLTDIGSGGDYVVGVKEDGTLLFAGEHSFKE